jgi:DMSO/TMAO reductase YedYZ heme-binding membrane subunit
MSTVIATSSGTALWYLARGSGMVSLVFLTVSVLLGITTSLRWSSPRWPRFVIEFTHRNVSLLVVVFLVIHILTVVSDSFAPIGWKDAVVPFVSAYRPLWLGFGALAFDLLIALAITSLLRHRIGFTAWRIVHWLAYACWPIAVIHGLGTGSDTKPGIILGVSTACVLTVLIAGSLRLATGLADRPGVRRLGFAGFALGPVCLVAWLVSGPLASGWAAKAGTPASVLATSAAATSAPQISAATQTTTSPPPPSGSGQGSMPATGFDAHVAGTFHQSAPDTQGQVVVSLIGTLSGGATGTLDIELRGRPLSGGGVALNDGTVTLTGNAASDHVSGPVVGLHGSQILANLSRADGSRSQVTIVFQQLDEATGQMAGTITSTPGR